MEKVNQLALVLAQATVEYYEADTEFRKLAEEGVTESDSAYRSWRAATRATYGAMVDAQNALADAAREFAQGL